MGNPKIPEIGTPFILDNYNFLCSRLIEVRSKSKLWPLSRAFQ
jgi:hypothetical protein